MIQSRDVHPGCANKHVPNAVVFVVLYAIPAILSWRDFHKALTMPGPADLFGDVIAIGIIPSFLASFKCVRERLVLGMTVIRLAEFPTLRVVPAFAASASNLLRIFNFVLWTVALGVSLTMLYSAVRHRRLIHSAIQDS